MSKMKCLAPLSLSPKAKGLARTTVPCGKCESCQSKRRNEWAFRNAEEVRVSKNSMFLTITYAENHITYTKDGEATLVKKDHQDFIKRLRHAISQLPPSILHDWPSLRFFMCGEYGDKGDRPHYHYLLYNLPPQIDFHRLLKIWGKGRIEIKPITDGRIHYVTKYTIRPWEKDNETKVKPFNSMSKNPGIGHNYINRAARFHKENETYMGVINGQKQPIPRYYKDRIFTPEEKESINESAILAEEKKDRQFVVSTPNYFEVEQIRREGFKSKVKKSSKGGKI